MADVPILDAVTDKTTFPAVPELDRLRLQNLFLQQQVCREQLNVLTLQFLQTPQLKALQERIDEMTQQINALAAKLFADAKVDAQQYQFNLEDGTFVARSERP